MNYQEISRAHEMTQLQMASEAFLTDENKQIVEDLIGAYIAGNKHTTTFAETEAARFAENWAVLDHLPNTSTGFSGTLFVATKDIPEAGVKAGDRVISIRSTEFIDDYVNDNFQTNQHEIKERGVAFGQIDDMQQWIDKLKADPALLGSC